MGRLIDLTGKVFGRLTVTARCGVNTQGKPLWSCLCSCGNTCKVSGGSLSSGDTRSCGCLQKEAAAKVAAAKNEQTVIQDGTRFSQLTVKAQAFIKEGHRYYVCACACGNQITVLGASLTSGNTRSCGCFKQKSHRSRQQLIPKGTRFTKLEVMGAPEYRAKPSGRHAAYYPVKCDCGNEFYAAASHLKRGATKSCGCYKAELSRARHQSRRLQHGTQFGRLRVIKFSHFTTDDPQTKQSMYLCGCQCGNEVLVRLGNLQSGMTRSCGCLDLESLRERTIARYKAYRKSRGFDPEFPITPFFRRIRSLIKPITIAVYSNAQGQCECCRSFDNTEVHHCVRVADDVNVAHDPKLMVVLCEECHYKAHGNTSNGTTDPDFTEGLVLLAQQRERLIPVDPKAVEVVKAQVAETIELFRSRGELPKEIP